VLTDPSGLSVGYQGSCYDFCGATYSSFEWSAAFLILATSLEIHHFGGAGWLSRQGPGDWICLDCKTVNIDTSTTSSSEPTTVEIDQGLANGRLSNQIGNSRVGQTVWDLIDSGISPEDIAVEETFQLRSGQLVRPDVAVYRNGGLDRFIEVKGGYASGTRALDQLSNYAQLAEERNISLTYKLFKSGSESFLSRLRLLHVPF